MFVFDCQFIWGKRDRYPATEQIPHWTELIVLGLWLTARAPIACFAYVAHQDKLFPGSMVFLVLFSVFQKEELVNTTLNRPWREGLVMTSWYDLLVEVVARYCSAEEEIME